jgi:hypothetical protein
MDEEQGPETPKKNPEKMMLDNMFPDVIIKIMFGDNRCNV